MNVGGEIVKPTWVMRRFGNLPITWGAAAGARSGDILLCEVVHTSLHGRVETTTGSRRKLYAGDRIVCVLANRYATSLLEAVARVDGDRADMVSASGLCGTVLERTPKASTPTSLKVLARAFVDGAPMHLPAAPLPAPVVAATEPRWVFVVGSAMDSGKTTACASLVRGLVEHGARVAALKLTGTASGRDYGAFADAGASAVFDFLDAGVASTAGSTRAELMRVAGHLVALARTTEPDWCVVEVADGILQPETRMILDALPELAPKRTIVVTTRESLAAVAAVEQLTAAGLDVDALSGLLTNSPLARREAELGSGVPTVRTSELGRWLAKREAVGALADPLASAGPLIESGL